jgi:mannose-1-phosphate guanylyltransferase/phosphomannomutase
MGRLGCDALAVNGFTDEHRPLLLRADIDRLLQSLSDHVRNSGSDLGVLLEPNGEIARIVDNEGRVWSHSEALFAFLSHETARGVTDVALPVSCSSRCAELVTRRGARVHWTPTALAAVMGRAAHSDIGFAGDANGALVFAGFTPAPDALMTFCKTLELLAAEGRPLSEVAADLPTAHIAVRDVQTPWDQKGAVMRHVASSAPPEDLMLLDGVKVRDPGGWALVIPFPDEPLCRIWAEAASSAEAEALADRFAALVYEVTGSGGRQVDL